MKRYAKNAIATVLGWQVRRLRKRADFKLVAIAGSVGKTSTKFAVANLLGSHMRVRWQQGNYNDIVSVPLVFFDLPLPRIFNPLSWLVTFMRIEISLRKPYPYDVVVVELGTDFPGNLAQFKKYIDADIGILTAIAPEHMTYFKGIDAVAKEELTIVELSEKLLINIDLCEQQHLALLEAYASYGTHQDAAYRLMNVEPTKDGLRFKIEKNDRTLLAGTHDSVAATQLIALTAAVAVGDMLGLDQAMLKQGITAVHPVEGRMRRLQGIKNSTILDDTYNASPEAVQAALDTLYSIEAPQKIALLGNMNELGDFSPEAHKKIGAYCNPRQLDLVVTLGPDANQYLADEAIRKGCRVIRVNTPHAAAEEIEKTLRDGAVILAKGSQNGVFAEEAVKKLLANPGHASLLVRQSDYWLKRKSKSMERG